MTDILIPPTVDALPPAPLITDSQADFNTKAFAFAGALDGLVVDINAAAGNVLNNATAVHERALLAQSSATTAVSARDLAQAAAYTAVNAPGTMGTSTTPLTVGTGVVTLTTQTGKAFAPGQTVVLASTLSPSSTRMIGVVASYNSGTGVLAVAVSIAVGGGTASAWTITLSAARDSLVSQGLGPGQFTNVLSFGWDNVGRVRVSVDGAHLGGMALAHEVQQAAPPGMVGMFSAFAPPAGWLKANGAAVSRATYSALFSVIGTYYGAGDGSTTFSLPDMRGLFARGWDDGRGIDPSRELGSFQDSQNLAHNHTLNDTGHSHTLVDTGHSHTASSGTAGSHNHTFSGRQNENDDAGGIAGGGGAVTSSEATSTAGSHNHTVTVNSATTGIALVSNGTGIWLNSSGGSEARPRNLALLACIKY